MHLKIVRSNTGPGRTEGRKQNKAFMILSALGILFVVDSHVGPNLSSYFVFPYDSFYMPMFAFISGYFFSEKHLQTWEHVFRFVDRKIRTLLIPYFLWIVFYGILTGLCRHLGIWDIGETSAIDLIHNILTGGTSFGFNDPSWFVPLLFCVVVFYTFLRKLLGSHWNHYTAMAIFAAFGAIAISLSQTEFRTHNTFMLMKIPCFLQYYHLGVLFREKLETAFDKVSALLLCALAAGINLAILTHYGPNISVGMYATMGGFELKAPFLPLITSITGIAFWLKISKVLVSSLGQNRLVNFISENTFFFMTHHLLVKHIFLGIFVVAHNSGLLTLQGLDIAQYRLYAWYRWNDSFLFSLASLIFTTAALIPPCILYNRIAAQIGARIQQHFPITKKQP